VLKPAAHTPPQTLEDAERAAADLTIDHLWQTPGGAGSIGFHLMHMSGATEFVQSRLRAHLLLGCANRNRGLRRERT
jgi:hypothetical protein